MAAGTRRCGDLAKHFCIEKRVRRAEISWNTPIETHIGRSEVELEFKVRQPCLL